MVVDEGHALRTPGTTWYRAVSRLLGGVQKDLALLTATPINNGLWDLYHLVMAFARHDRGVRGPRHPVAEAPLRERWRPRAGRREPRPRRPVPAGRHGERPPRPPLHRAPLPRRDLPRRHSRLVPHSSAVHRALRPRCRVPSPGAVDDRQPRPPKDGPVPSERLPERRRRGRARGRAWCPAAVGRA